jgi:hypothetical protein
VWSFCRATSNQHARSAGGSVGAAGSLSCLPDWGVASRSLLLNDSGKRRNEELRPRVYRTAGLNTPVDSVMPFVAVAPIDDRRERKGKT